MKHWVKIYIYTCKNVDQIVLEWGRYTKVLDDHVEKGSVQVLQIALESIIY